MPFKQSNQIRFYKFNQLDREDIVHAIFTRQGGVSAAPWQSLNVGGTVGDKPERVIENRRRSFLALGREPASIFDVWQVHGREVAIAVKPRKPEEILQQADILLTDQPGVTLFMRFADCVPILLHDPRQGVVGLVHAGWQGTVKRAAAAAIQALQTHYGCRPADVRAGIGPSIGGHHYPVGKDVIQQVRKSFNSRAEDFLFQADGQTHFDLWAANRAILEASGVESIENSDLCTACNPVDWYSHRGEHGRTGRFGALIALST
ncbi:MAG: peptidoglycan editing factor PgeF [Anaerolineales bacterium]|jgi:YfiH family protein